MKLDELRAKSAADLRKELNDLYKAGFGLRMQAASGQLTKNSEIKAVRRSIARIKTLLTEKGAAE